MNAPRRLTDPLTGRVTVTDIVERFRLSGASAVSNWRRRHDVFPAPYGICEHCGAAPAPLKFDGEAIEEWARANGKNYIRVRV